MSSFVFMASFMMCRTGSLQRESASVEFYYHVINGFYFIFFSFMLFFFFRGPQALSRAVAGATESPACLHTFTCAG